MAKRVKPPNGIKSRGKHYYSIWETIFEIDTRYTPIKPIGRGAFGTVCSAVDKLFDEKVAIKKIHSFEDSFEETLGTLREIKLLRHLRHENIVELRPLNRLSFKDLYLVYELMDTDLSQIIKTNRMLTDDHCQFFLFQLLRGLEYLHLSKVLHRDLKPENLLINANGELKICDFGLARTNTKRDQFMSEYVVTRWYRAPELLLGCNNYGTPIDIWSVGCIFAELLGRDPIFPGTESLGQLNLIIQILDSQREDDLAFVDKPKSRMYIKSLPYTMGTSFSKLYPKADPLAIDLLQKMLVFDPSKRISASEALRHPYLSPLHDPSYDPMARALIGLDIGDDIDEEDLEEGTIREMMWTEIIMHYHPDSDLS